MCGRYSLTTPSEAVRDLFGYLERPNLGPRANVAPSQAVAAVRLGGTDEAAEDGRRHFVWLCWGLIPAWAKDRAIGSRMINARAESVADKPAFRAAFRRRRCLIPADGFYEWRKEGAARQPYRIARADGAPFAFAGLWERWREPADDGVVESCTILTTEANALVRAIHIRMPVVLDPIEYEAWLDPQTPAETARALLRPAPAAGWIAYRVSARLNSPANDDPALVEPIDAARIEPAQPRLL